MAPSRSTPSNQQIAQELMHALGGHELTIETKRCVVSMEEFDHRTVGHSDGMVYVELGNACAAEETFDVAIDLMQLGPLDSIVMWADGNPIELSRLWAGTTKSLDMSPDEHARFEAELYFADATPI